MRYLQIYIHKCIYKSALTILSLHRIIRRTTEYMCVYLLMCCMTCVYTYIDIFPFTRQWFVCILHSTYLFVCWRFPSITCFGAKRHVQYTMVYLYLHTYFNLFVFKVNLIYLGLDWYGHIYGQFPLKNTTKKYVYIAIRICWSTWVLPDNVRS